MARGSIYGKTSDLVLPCIRFAKRRLGGAFTPSDFADIGGQCAVGMVLSRLVKTGRITTTLCRRSQDGIVWHFCPPGPLEKMIPERQSRHYADLATPAQTEIVKNPLQRDDPRARLVANKQVFFPTIWARTETAVQGAFRLMPQGERIVILSRD